MSSLNLESGDLRAILDFVEGLDALSTGTGIDITKTPIFLDGEILGYVDIGSGGYYFTQND